jgi:hypothetical protein
MKTKIQNVLKQSFPEFVPLIESDEFSTYKMLHQLADQSLQFLEHNEDEPLKDVFATIDNLYQFGTLYDKNAIENEYLMILSRYENSISFGKHLKLMPKTLRAIFLKTIIEG